MAKDNSKAVNTPKNNNSKREYVLLGGHTSKEKIYKSGETIKLSDKEASSALFLNKVKLIK